MSGAEEVVMLEPVALLGVVVVEMLVPKGLTLEFPVPPAAVTRFRVAVPMMECWRIGAAGLLVERGGPGRWAHIQVDSGFVKDMEPPIQELQFVPYYGYSR